MLPAARASCMKSSFKRVAWNVSVCLTLVATLVAGPFRVYAAPDAWTGTTDALWNTTTNWSAGLPISTSDVTFPLTIPPTGNVITLGAGELANTLTFLNNYTLTGAGSTLALT